MSTQQAEAVLAACFWGSLMTAMVGLATFNIVLLISGILVALLIAMISE